MIGAPVFLFNICNLLCKFATFIYVSTCNLYLPWNRRHAGRVGAAGPWILRSAVSPRWRSRRSSPRPQCRRTRRNSFAACQSVDTGYPKIKSGVLNLKYYISCHSIFHVGVSKKGMDSSDLMHEGGVYFCQVSVLPNKKKIIEYGSIEQGFFLINSAVLLY